MTLAARSRTAWVHAADFARSACGGGGAMGVVDDDRGGRERRRRRRGAQLGRRRRKRRRAWDVMVVTGVRMSGDPDRSSSAFGTISGLRTQGFKDLTQRGTKVPCFVTYLKSDL